MMNEGMSIPHMTMPSDALLMERQIMSPKHFLVGRCSLVASHVATVNKRAMMVQTNVAYLGLGGNRFLLSALMVISMPNTKWKIPVTNISATIRP
jgi:hypothetical protein